MLRAFIFSETKALKVTGIKHMLIKIVCKHKGAVSSPAGITGWELLIDRCHPLIYCLGGTLLRPRFLVNWTKKKPTRAVKCPQWCHRILFQTETAPDPKIFFENYMKPRKAAVFRGAVLGTRSFNLWTPEYLSEHFGDLEIRIEQKKQKV